MWHRLSGWAADSKEPVLGGWKGGILYYIEAKYLVKATPTVIQKVNHYLLWLQPLAMVWDRIPVVACAGSYWLILAIGFLKGRNKLWKELGEFQEKTERTKRMQGLGVSGFEKPLFLDPRQKLFLSVKCNRCDWVPYLAKKFSHG
jgi:hypothetical protein